MRFQILFLFSFILLSTLAAHDKSLEMKRKVNTSESYIIPLGHCPSISEKSASDTTHHPFFHFKKEFKWMPLIGYNDNDRFMAGFSYNKKGQKGQNSLFYSFSPFFAFGSQQLVGYGRVGYRTYLDADKRQFLNGEIQIKSFHEDFNKTLDYHLRYAKIAPKVTFAWEGNDSIVNQKRIYLVANFISTEKAKFSELGEFNGKYSEKSFIPVLGFMSTSVNQYTNQFLDIAAEYQHYSDNKSYMKLTGSYHYGYKYHKNHAFKLRTFVSGFLMNTERKSNSYQNVFTRGSIALIEHGFNDYTYNETFLARQNQSGFQDNQVSRTQGGGFKTAIGSAYNIGMSNSFAASLNVEFDLPLPKFLPIGIYIDAGTYSTYNVSQKRQNNTIYNSGLYLNFFKLLYIYVPISSSDELHNTFVSQHPKALDRLTFSLNMCRLSR